MSETDKALRARLIASGQLRPNTKELEPIQLNPGAVVFREVPENEWVIETQIGYSSEWIFS